MPKSTMTQKERYFKKLEEQQQAAAAAAAAAEPPRTTGSVRSNDTDSKTTGVFANFGVYHEQLGAVMIPNGTDVGYIRRKQMNFNNSAGELSEGQQILVVKQATSNAIIDFIEAVTQNMVNYGERTLEITPVNVTELTEDTVVINFFNKYQYAIVLVNTNAEREGTVEVNKENIAALFA